jgi:hypothetical protein
MTLQPGDFRARAQECERHAIAATTGEARDQWLQLAYAWNALAFAKEQRSTAEVTVV